MPPPAHISEYNPPSVENIINDNDGLPCELYHNTIVRAAYILSRTATLKNYEYMGSFSDGTSIWRSPNSCHAVSVSQAGFVTR